MNCVEVAGNGAVARDAFSVMHSAGSLPGTIAAALCRSVTGGAERLPVAEKMTK